MEDEHNKLDLKNGATLAKLKDECATFASDLNNAFLWMQVKLVLMVIIY